MASNALFNQMAAVGFFNLFPMTGLNPRKADPPVSTPSIGDKFKHKLGLDAPPLPPKPSLKGNPVRAQGIVAKEVRVGMGNFSRDMKTPGQLRATNSSYPAKLDIMIGDSAAPGIPTFYLPYQNDQNFRITLVDRQGLNAAFCTTAFLDGCSIYVEGTQADPTIYHINAIGTTAAPVPLGSHPDAQHIADWQAKYAKMDSRFRGDALKLPSGPSGPKLPKRVRQMDSHLLNPGKLENHDYMIAAHNFVAFEATLAALQAAGKARAAVGTQSVDEMVLLTTQGTMFGVKTGGLWRMYVQRRALVQYFHVNAGHPPVNLGKQWIVRDVQEFWPTVGVGTQFSSIW